MFPQKTYSTRRKKLASKIKSGILIFPGNTNVPMNYASNTYKFRQDSNFLYFWGLDEPDLFAILDIDENKEIIFGNNRTVDEVVWMGPDLTIEEKAAMVGVSITLGTDKVYDYCRKAIASGRKVHFLPQYRAENIIKLSELLGIYPSQINNYISNELRRAVIDLRIVKTSQEISEIEKALAISYEMNTLTMRLIKPGMYEKEIYGAVEGLALALGNGISFPVIFSIHGETLHNESHENLMNAGDIAVLDSGVESPLHYASDITRTIPISGKFTQRQKDIYSIVLNAQLTAINIMKPGVSYRDVHIEAARVIAQGLKELGLMKGDVEEAVSNGAHALFFPHGLGHMLGLDVHDMEGMGEDFVGYDQNVERSKQFGLAYLRFAKLLKPGHVITVEPGIYFIPQLIDMWKSKKKLTQFINYKKVEKFKDFGGIRIEDDVLITKNSSKVLGKHIPKTIDEVEEECKK